MNVVLYISGEEGFLALKVALEYARVLFIVLPEGADNQDILNLAQDNELPVKYREKSRAADLTGNDEAVLVSRCFSLQNIFPRKGDGKKSC